MVPFGNLYRVPVYVDQSLSADENIVFNAGTHVDTIKIKYADFERLVQPAKINAAIPLEMASGQ
jgi:Ala-tRNA(Pro) deacylase